jgi:hypothetical protein
MYYGPNSSFLSNCNRDGKKQVEIFRQRLDKKVRKEFDKMFSYSRLYNSAGSNACRPILIHPIFVSIIFEHYKQLNALEKATKK